MLLFRTHVVLHKRHGSWKTSQGFIFPTSCQWVLDTSETLNAAVSDINNDQHYFLNSINNSETYNHLRSNQSAGISASLCHNKMCYKPQVSTDTVWCLFEWGWNIREASWNVIKEIQNRALFLSNGMQRMETLVWKASRQ